MNKLIPMILSSILTFGVAACSNVAKTSADAPNSTDTNGQAPNLDIVLNNKSDATSEIRRNQANSDIRAREQRYDMFRQGGERSDRNLESEVRSKLEVNIPSSQLAVNAKNGVVTVAGIVQTQKQLGQIEPLAKQIRGVKSVIIKAKVEPNLPPYNNR
ncbi:BON domain-containing protein [Aetokthonos hydrillicola Thurmond2011]|jgi:osmotically-inducible protein OsmY|uniref:BON domain-containing protein n=1 Tax=Aetokthonos hydrillicola Thurmond2011 TaxID=2712845 RepID=A0AAP5IAM2_9CYAN|nr:BON domain-containing protein [Aetokthonos hydrillicola]MBO3461586.1 BON domain-containing protein [Aetokthonos hydrillicola CCALA 1050]MBW4586112.1 BON domain-containing protein [Aetokthonos hydrillicola CCALA 1050]MDR9897719.1 BON domain-containing protein [Aetokthonos hydrillicola Thurmond2011]